MKKYKKLIGFLLLVFLLQNFIPRNVEAQNTPNNIILLMDNSGSMKQTDPKRLSIIAASMLIDSIDDNSSINVIPFGEKPEGLYNIADNPDRESLKRELSDIKFDSNYTDVKEALKEALAQLNKVQGQKSIVVLSDGKEEPLGGITKAHKEEFSSIIEQAHSAGIKVNCIALSEKADKESLSNMAFRTEGQFYYSSNPSELFNIFSKLLGSINDFYTIQEYTAENEGTKEIKLSGYIQEVTIKIASFDSEIPDISVETDKGELSASKLGQGYKIYNFKNEEDRTIDIHSRDKGRYSVIVQIKSKAKLLINSASTSFSVPKGVPIDIDISLEDSKSIMGLHMDRLEGEKRESINKNGDTFSFTFNKSGSGQYPMLITAYDGEGRIIAVNNLNINVTDYPAFYYITPLPKEMVLDKSYSIDLKQLTADKVINPSGEIIVDYGDKQEGFPLKYVDNTLSSEVILRKLQAVKITACISGILGEDSFSYYLPYSNINAAEIPFIELGVEKSKSYVKQNQKITVSFDIKKSKLYSAQDIFVYDTKGNKLGEFTVPVKNPSDSSESFRIAADIYPKVPERNITLLLKPKENVKITEKIATGISVLTPFWYYFEPFRLPVGILTALGILLLIFNSFIKFQYKRFNSFTITKELVYNITSISGNSFLYVTLSPEENLQYLNLKGRRLEVEEESGSEVGYFLLKLPKGNKMTKAIKYFLYKEKLFSVQYYGTMPQQFYKEEEELEDFIEYERDIKIIVKNKKEEINIYFS